MARHHQDDDDDVVVVERGGSPVVPFLWGLAVGAAAALLFAPTSGDELRSNIKTRASRMKDLALEKVDEVEDTVGHGYERARAKVEEELEAARHFVGETRHAAKDVVDAGKAATSTAREELERRLVEARKSRRAARQTPADEEPVA